LKILIVHSHMDLLGGAETVVIELARYLEQKGIKNTILTLSSAPHKEYENLNIITPPSDYLVKYRLRGERFSDLLEILRCAKTLENLVSSYIDDFDVVNPHNFPAVWAIPPTGKRVVWMCNEIPDIWHSLNPSLTVRAMVGFGRLCDRWIVNRRADRAVVSDRKNALLFQKRYGWYPEIVPYGIAGSFFAQKPTEREKEEVRNRYEFEYDGFYVIHVGMISPSKNQFETIRAVEKLREKVPKIKAILVGHKEKNSYALFLERYIEKKKIGDHIIFIGHKNREELRTLYNVSHVAVSPVKGQGSWLSPFEALATGKPVIVSPELSCSTLIRENSIGVVTDSLENALLDVYERYGYFLGKAYEGRRFVLENLTWKRFCEKFLEILLGRVTSTP